MNFKENNHYLLIFIFFTLICFFLSNYIGLDRHWVTNYDHEFTLIYNALLFNSHIPIEYVQHPGYFTILFLSIFFKLLSFFDFISVYKLTLLNNDNFEDSFQKLVFFTRIYSVIFLSLFCSLAYFLFYKLTDDKKYSFILSLIVFFAEGTIFHLFQLRTELITMIFIVLSLISLKTFLEGEKKNSSFYLIFFITFIICSVLNKMQVFFLLPFFIFTLIFCDNKVSNFDTSNYNFLKKKFTPHIIFLIILFYIFSKNKNIFDPLPVLSTLALLINLGLINLFFFLIFKKNSKEIKINLIFINFCFILVYLVIKNILLIHPSTSEIIFTNLTRIMNLSMYISDAPNILNPLKFMFDLIIKFFNNFFTIINLTIFKINFFSSLLFLNIFITFIYRKYLTTRVIKFNLSCLLGSFFILIINSYRTNGELLTHYMIFSELILIMSFCSFSKFFQLKYLTMILITLIFINATNNLSYIKNQRLIENEKISNKIITLCKTSYFYDWQKKIDKEYFKNFCKKYSKI